MTETAFHRFGVVTGTTTGNQLPNVPVRAFRLQASNANYTVMKIGDSANNIVWELAAGEEIDFVDSVTNLNNFYVSAVSGIHEKLVYWALV